MNLLVRKETTGWPENITISLKFVTRVGKTIFNTFTPDILSDIRFNFKPMPTCIEVNYTDRKLLQMLECSVVDCVLHLPELDLQSNLWTVGWCDKFQWGFQLPARCAYDFHEQLAQLMYSIVDPQNGRYRSFQHDVVRGKPNRKNSKKIPQESLSSIYD
jgi:hypothetical protein